MKTWTIHIGQSAPGRGIVIDKMRTETGHLVLIVRTDDPLMSNSNRFLICEWYGKDDEPTGLPKASAQSLEEIYVEWIKFLKMPIDLRVGVHE